MPPYFYDQYQSMQQPYQNQMQSPPKRMDVIKVSGENGAKAFQLAPNSSVLLLDETAPIVWLKTTDGAGYPSIKPFEITPYQPKPQVGLNELEQRIQRIEVLLNDKSNAISNQSGENKTTVATDKAN